jgi:glutamate carboxypeptidase
MMNPLNTIDAKFQEMVALVEAWVNINSHASHQRGIEILLKEVEKAFSALHPESMERVTLGKGQALFLTKRAKAPIQIYFGGHLDTVYSPQSPFQKATYLDEHTMRGPGATDMKGGLVVLLKALETFETIPEAAQIGWQIFLNCDEEIGSIYSTAFIESLASRCQLACIFEPSFPDGALVSQRKGSATYHVWAKGKKAHAGRTPEEGKNAIYPLARFITQVAPLTDFSKGILVNVGVVQGGEATNIIPDYAACDLNVRCDTPESQHALDSELRHFAQEERLELTRISFRPPKPFDSKTQSLFQELKSCASQLGIDLKWRASGGVCDGNTLAAKGVPTIDTLGVRGGNIHTDEEYLDLRSLCERTKLTLLFLQEIARGKIKL